jgi:hypothetical protein
MVGILVFHECAKVQLQKDKKMKEKEEEYFFLSNHKDFTSTHFMQKCTAAFIFASKTTI